MLSLISLLRKTDNALIVLLFIYFKYITYIHHSDCNEITSCISCVIGPDEVNVYTECTQCDERKVVSSDGRSCLSKSLEVFFFTFNAHINKKDT